MLKKLERFIDEFNNEILTGILIATWLFMAVWLFIGE